MDISIIKTENISEFITIIYYSDGSIVKIDTTPRELEIIPPEPPIQPEKPPLVDNSDLKYLEKKLIEQDKGIFKLKSENADVLLDLATKDAEILALKTDISDVMMEIVMMGGVK